MTTETRDALIVCGLTVFIVLVMNSPRSRAAAQKGAAPVPVPSEAKESDVSKHNNALVVITAFKNAMKAGEGNETLRELNDLTMQRYGLKISKQRNSKLLCVVDAQGNKVFEEK